MLSTPGRTGPPAHGPPTSPGSIRIGAAEQRAEGRRHGPEAPCTAPEPPVPLQPGKAQAFRDYVTELEGPQKEGEEDFLRRNGTRREAIWLQSTPQGDIAVVYWEGEEAQRFQDAQSDLIASDDPFGRFVGENFADIFGVDPSAGLPPLPEKVRDYHTATS